MYEMKKKMFEATNQDYVWMGFCFSKLFYLLEMNMYECG